MTAPVPLVERLAEVVRRCINGVWFEEIEEQHRRKGIDPARCNDSICLRAMEDARALLPVVEQVVTEARGEALCEAADAYDPATEHQARGWVKGWLLDRAEAAGGKTGRYRPLSDFRGRLRVTG